MGRTNRRRQNHRPKKQKTTSEKPEVPKKMLFTLKIKGVDEKHSLHDIVLDLLDQNIKSIINCYRSAEYKNKILGTDVFITLTKRSEYAKLIEIDDHRINILDQVGLFIARNEFKANATTMPEALHDEYKDAASDWVHNLPCNVKLLNLRLCHNVSTFYLVSILRAFQKYAKTITGVSVLYDLQKNRTRDTGYLSSLDRTMMLELKETYIRLSTLETIKCVPGFSIPQVYTTHNTTIRVLQQRQDEQNDERAYDSDGINLAINCLILIPIEVEATPTEANETIVSEQQSTSSNQATVSDQPEASPNIVESNDEADSERLVIDEDDLYRDAEILSLETNSDFDSEIDLI
jgi:hypothetical protein